VKYPDFEDYGYQTDWTTLYNAVDFVCHSSDDDFREHFAEYFDLPLVIDYYILMETILATDNHGKNMFFACYDMQKDKKITFGVWDMDATCGQRWSDQYYHWSGMQPEQDYATYIWNNEHGDYNLFKRLRDTNADDFNMQVRLRYRDLRDNYLATENILNRFSTYLNRFKLCGADQREYDKWNGDSDISNLALDFDDEMEYLTDWFTRRLNYLDTQRFDIGSLPPSGISSMTLASQGSSKVYNLRGQQVGTADQLKQLPAGIYIIGGKKVVVK
jgi:spore coat protein CotH